jgi:two-component sensor histidine kinase
MARILLLILLCISVFQWQPICAQKSFLSDYAMEQIQHVPEEKQDSFYLVQGKYFYAFYTRESYRKSMECYLEALRLALQYQHPNLVLKCYFGIGAVYDANNNMAQAIRYYKLYYDGVLKERPFNANNILRASYNIASTYAKAGDAANAYHYTLKMAQMLDWVKDPMQYDDYCLLISHIFVGIGKNAEFQEYFNKISPNATFEDGELAYGRLYAESKSKFAYFKGMKDSVVPPILFELGRTRDSIPLLNVLIEAYVSVGNYKQAYETQEMMIDADKRSMDKSTYGDINYRLLEADNLLRQKKNVELQVTAQELRFKTSFLYAISFLLALGLVVTWYMYRRYRIKNKLNDQQINLTKQHEESNHLLLKELHSGINESLNILAESLDEQFDTLGHLPDELKREIKAGLNCITISHDILKRNDEINRVELLPYFKELTQQTLEIFEVQDIDVEWKLDMPAHQMDVSKLIPLAMGVVELLKTTIKNTLVIATNATIEIQCRLKDGEYHFTYKEKASMEMDYGNSTVISKMDTKLLHNFLRQIDAKMLMDDSKAGQNDILIVFVK